MMEMPHSSKKQRHIRDLFSLQGRVALITGASGQLGSSLARALHEAGARLILLDKNPTRCEAWASRHTTTDQEILSLEADVTVKASLEAALSASIKRFKTIDILINNAGIGIFTPFESRTEEEFQAVLDVNLKGTFLCTQVFSAPMKKQKAGSIVNIGSIYGLVSADPRIYGDSGRNSSEVYAATKAGIIHMSRYYAVHLAPHKIRVNVISPGGVFNHQKEDFVQNYVQKIPFDRMATEEDLNGAVVYLASDASSYVTGHNLIVDGGFTIW